MRKLNYNNCGNCIYSTTKKNDKGIIVFAGKCNKHKKKVSEYDRACRDHIETAKTRLNTFYFCNLNAWKERSFFLCVERTTKNSMGLSGYCKSIEKAIEKIPCFVPFCFSKKKLAENFKRLIEADPNKDYRQIYFVEVPK